MKIVDIYTCLAANSKPYATHLYYILELLKSGENHIRYWTIGNDKFKSTPINNWTHLGNVNTDLPPSASHASALNSIIDNIPGNSDFIIVADCDVAVLQKNWDNTMIAQMDKFDCVGTPKFCHVLSVYFTMFKTAVFRDIVPNFMPGNINTRSVPWHTIEDQIEADYYMMEVGDRIVQDTGWRIPRQLREKGYNYKMIEYVQDDTNALGLLFTYYLDGVIFVSHMSGSYKTDHGDMRCALWRQGVKSFVKKHKDDVSLSVSKLQDIHKGEVAYIIGKGPSLQWLNKSYFDKGIVITLNQAITKVNELGLSNLTYSIQKEGPDPWGKGDACNNDCFNCSAFAVDPAGATLIVNSNQSPLCFKDYKPRIMINQVELGLTPIHWSAALAIQLAKHMGCMDIKLLCFDSINGELRSYVSGEVLPRRNKNLIRQLKGQKSLLQDIKHEYILPVQLPQETI